MTEKEIIAQGRTTLGIEFGSTRIKACLIGEDHAPLASGSHAWENRLENGYWTYSQQDIISGLQNCFKSLCCDVREKYRTEFTCTGAIGISAMMHGYLAFDENDELLVPFRTWRNTTTEQAASELTELLGFNVPQRWTCSHLYQAVLNGEEHISKIAHVTTLAGYIHFLLTGKRVVGVGEASGIFPVDGGNYDGSMAEKYNSALAAKDFTKNLYDVFPAVLSAGENAGVLTESGAKILDPLGNFKAGCPLCPPEGDAGTGMTATNSVRAGTGNVSAGTSIFSMLVLDKPLSGVYPEIDVVTTPDGVPVAMVHCNNCCSELDAWVRIFGSAAKALGADVSADALYEMFYSNAAQGDDDCGGVCAYNLLSGEPVVKVDEGRPMYFRMPDSKMNIRNFCRAQVYSAFAALRSGMDILFDKEKVSADLFTGHGGMFKVKGVAQQILANALKTPVAVMKTAGEGGAWGMALLAGYMLENTDLSLADWLDKNVFADMERSVLQADAAGSAGFDKFMKKYTFGLDAQRALKNAEEE